MKHTFILFMTMAISISLCISCNKEDAVDPGNKVPLVTPVGIPNGTTATISIDATGGMLTSADGIVQLTVPEGAVLTATVFTIQPLTNNCPGGAGNAYRLLPEGIFFAQPVTVTFHYADSVVANENFLSIAYQGADQTWFAPRVNSRNEAGNLISVQTKHFSDWSIFERLSISPKKASVKINESVSLKVTFVGELNTITDAQGVELNNLNTNEDVTTTWQASSGTIVKQGEDRALYTAPSTLPTKNPADVSVTFTNVSFVVNGNTFTNPKLFGMIDVFDQESYFAVEFSSSLSYQPVGNNVFTETDYGSLKLFQHGDSVTVYDIRNFDAEVTPGSLFFNGCTTTLLHPGDGPYNIPEDVHFGGNYYMQLNQIYVGYTGPISPTGVQASFEKVCTVGAPLLIGGGVITTSPLGFTIDAGLEYQEQVVPLSGGGIFPDGFMKMAVTKLR